MRKKTAIILILTIYIVVKVSIVWLNIVSIDDKFTLWGTFIWSAWVALNIIFIHRRK